MNIPKEVEEIIKKLNENNFEAYIVGGCVRDYLLGNEPKDWDITTSALPDEIKRCFNHTVDTGIEHGTVTVILNHKNFEVTTYRIDGEYTDSRHPQSVTFTKNIDEDLSRRDFTMNAIAYNNLEDKFIDPFGGIDDIKQGIIRGVGDADLRFNEDALRMMRAVRFASQLGFKIEYSTYTALVKNAELIKNISIERTRDEFLKLILSDHIHNIMLLTQSGLLQLFLNEITDFINNNLELIEFAFKRLEKNVAVRLAFLFKDLTKTDTTKILKRLKMDTNTIKLTSTLVDYYHRELMQGHYNTRVVMSELGEDIFKKLLNIRFVVSNYEKNLQECKKLDNIYDEIDDVIKRNECFSLKTLAVNGNDLKNSLNINGKEVGLYLKKALDIVMREPSKNKRDLILKELVK